MKHHMVMRDNCTLSYILLYNYKDQISRRTFGHDKREFIGEIRKRKKNVFEERKLEAT